MCLSHIVSRINQLSLKNILCVNCTWPKVFHGQDFIRFWKYHYVTSLHGFLWDRHLKSLISVRKDRTKNSFSNARSGVLSGYIMADENLLQGIKVGKHDKICIIRLVLYKTLVESILRFVLR
jgi:hypothetical protein